MPRTRCARMARRPWPTVGDRAMRRSLLALFLLSTAVPTWAADLPLDKIKLPPGFRIEVAARVENAREMALGARGTLFVGSMQAGEGYAGAPRAGETRAGWA